MTGHGVRCGKCEGANVPSHARRCPLRDPDEVVDEYTGIPEAIWIGDPADDPRLKPERGDDAAGPAN